MKSAAVQSRPAISVIIVNFNAGARLRKCLDALAAQNRRADEVIVIDNGSSDDSLNAARNEPGVKIIEAGENLGFAAANNRAVRQATGDWLAFLNPDAYPFVNWLEEIDAAIERYPHDFRYAIDAGKIARELNWRPSVSIEDGLRQTVAWYLENQSWWEAIRARGFETDRLGVLEKEEAAR